VLIASKENQIQDVKDSFFPKMPPEQTVSKTLDHFLFLQMLGQ